MFFWEVRPIAKFNSWFKDMGSRHVSTQPRVPATKGATKLFCKTKPIISRSSGLEQLRKLVTLQYPDLGSLSGSKETHQTSWQQVLQPNPCVYVT